MSFSIWTTLPDTMVSDSGQRSTDRGFGRHVDHDGASCRSADPRIADAHHIADALLQQFLWQRQKSPFRHARCAKWPGVAHNQHVVRVDVEVRIVDVVFHIVVILKHEGAAAVGQQFG